MRVILAVVAALVLASPAYGAGPSMRVGATEDRVKQTSLVGAKAQLELFKLAGLDTVRATSVWAPAEVAPDAADLKQLDNLLAAARLANIAVYVGVSNFGSRTTPLTPEARAQFAAYAASIAARYPTLRGVIVGNEPNLNRFWLPQFNPDGSNAAAPAFLQLLAQTYDAIKAANPRMRVMGLGLSPRGNDNADGVRLTHSPTKFLRDLGIAYRASGRTLPIMDALAFHPYGDNSSQPPTFAHPRTTSIGVADYGKLVGLLAEAFDGTAQQGSTLPILYDEYGVETQIPSAKAPLYNGDEPTTTRPTDEVTQASFYGQAIALAFCQPRVEGILLFHTVDEETMATWQSGLFYADGTPKAGLAAVRDAAARSRRGVIAQCEGLQLTPRLRVLRWPAASALRKHRASTSFTCHIDCRYEALLTRAGRLVTLKVGTAVGGVRKSVPLRTNLARGVYTLRLTLTAPLNTGPPLQRTSAPLVVP
jgi:hypothetical protein